ncbi:MULTISPECIES: hypothetical protein [unclassified Ensifer]|uniref:hypothetical protein n=1 Tax=unclassified Ensifer TaxID=2633371 RepID=UPI00070DE6A7|nr:MULTISPECIES: hypothetical protein [unclassified Ensifer]KQU91213.1 hypothetical protein ASD00_25990 [Ensifer sp. Root31]KQW39670.1 hypothetical protein ASD02_14880 [Ensifer sp. Root1252]KRC60228.1 hypothetical protein ASE32_14540 [Ensifer sp. Root231]KRC90567.1 hypothetical protein ASE47_11970 [Ensifer sp. Root258]OMQ45521.1 hypothetical protein BKP54_06240 [Ensifer sp. 1H6]
MTIAVSKLRAGPFSAILAACMLISLPAQSQALTDDLTTGTLTGTCESLIVAGEDWTSQCDGMLVQSVYPDGRSGFTVFLKSGVAVTFRGREAEKPDPDSQLQSVNRIVVDPGKEAAEFEMKEVAGGCGYTNPFKGEAMTVCEATDIGKSQYALQFRSDGKPPQMERDGSDQDEAKRESSEQKFQVGSWTGDPLDGGRKGCLMSKNVDRKIALILYADRNQAFHLSLFNNSWNLTEKSASAGDLRIGGKAFALREVDIRTPHLLTVHVGADRDALQSALAQSAELTFQSAGAAQTRVDLAGADEAIKALNACVK